MMRSSSRVAPIHAPKTPPGESDKSRGSTTKQLSEGSRSEIERAITSQSLRALTGALGRATLGLDDVMDLIESTTRHSFVTPKPVRDGSDRGRLTMENQRQLASAEDIQLAICKAYVDRNPGGGKALAERFNEMLKARLDEKRYEALFAFMEGHATWSEAQYE